MKMRSALLGLLLVGSPLLFVGCGEKAAQAPSVYDVQGVKVDLPKLQEAFVNGSPEQQVAVRNTATGIRYGQYPQALMGLDKLLNDPNTTEEQKKVVNQVIEQVKQLMSKAPAQPGQ